jgi:hypothetical protein
VAQPSLTRAIKLLEDEFGGELVHRERANTHLTEPQPFLGLTAPDGPIARRPTTGDP